MAGLFDLILAKATGGGQAVQNLLDQDNSANRLEQLRSAGTFGEGERGPTIRLTGGITPGQPLQSQPVFREPDAGLFGTNLQASKTAEAFFEAGDRQSVTQGGLMVQRAAEANADLTNFQRTTLAQDQRQHDALMGLRYDQQSWDQLLANDKRNREFERNQFTDINGFEKQIQNNTVIQRGQMGLDAFGKIRALQVINPATMLEFGALTVLLSQIYEPGLAVRKDDSDRITGGAQSGLSAAFNSFNQWKDGRIDVNEAWPTMMANAEAVMASVMPGFTAAVDHYKDRSDDLDNFGPDDVESVLGITEDQRQILRELTAVIDQDYGTPDPNPTSVAQPGPGVPRVNINPRGRGAP